MFSFLTTRHARRTGDIDLNAADRASGLASIHSVPFLRRQLVTAALTANAIRPVPGSRAGIPAFFAGWLTGELAPHLLALTAADTAAHAFGAGARSKAGAAAGGRERRPG